MGEVDDNDEETAQSEVQSAGSNRSDPGREDAESVGIAVQGASDPDCEVAQVGTVAFAGAIRGRANAAE